MEGISLMRLSHARPVGPGQVPRPESGVVRGPGAGGPVGGVGRTAWPGWCAPVGV